MEELQKILQDTVDRWCPPNFNDESFSNRMARALLNLNAYEEDFKATENGKQPIRTDYPLPLPKM